MYRGTNFYMYRVYEGLGEDHLGFGRHVNSQGSCLGAWETAATDCNFVIDRSLVSKDKGQMGHSHMEVLNAIYQKFFLWKAQRYS